MKWLLKLIIQILANALAIAIAVYFVPQITFSGDWLDYLVVGAILAVANSIIRPILKIISAPLIFITAGLFLIVINALILFGIDWFVEALAITNIWGYLWGTIIISLVNALVVPISKKRK